MVVHFIMFLALKMSSKSGQKSHQIRKFKQKENVVKNHVAHHLPPTVADGNLTVGSELARGSAHMMPGASSLSGSPWIDPYSE